MSSPTHSPNASRPAETGEQFEESVRNYVDQLRAFYIHAAVFGAAMVVIFMVNLATNAAEGTMGFWWTWWSAWAFIGWGLGIAIHGLVVRLNRPAPTSSAWEQRQIDKLLAKAVSPLASNPEGDSR